MRSSAEMTHARAGPVAGFKRCCMLSGDMDGSDRDYFFSAELANVLSNNALERSVKTWQGCAAGARDIVAPAAHSFASPRPAQRGR